MPKTSPPDAGPTGHLMDHPDPAPAWRVETPIDHDGERYAAGAEIHLPPGQAAPLVAVGALVPLTAPDLPPLEP